MKRMLLSMVAAIALVGFTEQAASAQGFAGSGRLFGQFGGFGGFGSTNIFDLYRTGQTPIPPYFALNPPVYYSYPVPRTYGYSPFYYPGDIKTPDVIVEIQPAMIHNPFVPSSTTATPEPENQVNNEARPAEPPTAGPLMVENPFFKQQADVYNVSH
ncbi:MAG: hypothetical protein AAGB00_08340 [Planctomycetota bacterium]